MVSVIIAAAGSGSRMQSDVKKQFILLKDIPVLIRTLRKFELDMVDEIVIVTNSDDIGDVNNLIKTYEINKVSEVVAGGASRQASIYKGLKAVKGDKVLIHDAARPFIKKEVIEANIMAIENGIGIITAVASKDTIKVVEDQVVVKTLDRSKLMNVQTPQSFVTKELLKAYDLVNEECVSVTDDASVFEYAGMTIKTVEGSYQNIKLTTPEDLWIGEAILKRG